MFRTLYSLYSRYRELVISYLYTVDTVFRVLIRVSDPYSFFPDPDPAFEAGDQSGSGSDPDPGL
jgi:hypothetical protein